MAYNPLTAAFYVERRKRLRFNAPPPNAKAGVAYSYRLGVTGGVAPVTFAVTGGAIPSGLSLASDGLLSGTVAAAGTTAGIVITATDARGVTLSATIGFTVDP